MTSAAIRQDRAPDLSPSERHDAIVVGGGWFGCRLAQHLRGYLDSVVVLEQDADLLQRASYNNQARVHQGYHYPRSILTALRSRVNFKRFADEYPECIDRSFTKYYAIGRGISKVTARQFRIFCERIGAPIEPAPDEVKALFDWSRIEDVFLVEEWAFDAVKLKDRVVRDLAAAGVEVRLQTRAQRVSAAAGGGVVVDVVGPRGPERLHGAKVFNCTYSGINHLLEPSGLPLIPLKHESTEMALVEPPDELRALGITVMCGPFFSLMPFPPLGLHTLSHVRYTPHHSWQERDGVRSPPPDGRPELASRQDLMLRDASRYLPALRGCRYKGSLWEVKTVLPESEIDDSRPILFRNAHGLDDLVCVMGGKVDNVYDVLQEIDVLRTGAGKARAMTVSDVFVSVVAPLQNDADIVEGFVSEVMAVLEANYSNFELVLVDDGSRDDTPVKVSGLLARHKCVRYLRLSRVFGTEVAISAGLDSVIGDFTVVMLPECDPPALIPEMVAKARAGSGVVVGTRPSRAGQPLWSRLGAKLFYGFANRFLGLDLPPDASLFQVLSRQAVNAITRIKEKYRSLRLLSFHVGFDAQRFAYEPRWRRGKARVRSLAESLGLAVGLVIGRSTRPLRVVSGLGLIASSLNLLYMVYVVAIYLFKPGVQPGWTTTSLQLSSMFFLLFAIMTVLTEYIGRILDESRDRPLYHVSEERNSNVSLAHAERRNVTTEQRGA